MDEQQNVVKSWGGKKLNVWIRCLNSKDGQDCPDYIAARNEATYLARKARKDHVNTHQKTKTSIANLRNEDGTFLIENKDKAEALSRQYSRTFTREYMATFPTFTDKEIQINLRTVLTKDRVMTKLQHSEDQIKFTPM